MRAKYIELTLASIRCCVDPEWSGYVRLDYADQALVDAALIAQGLLRAPTQLWGGWRVGRTLTSASMLSRPFLCRSYGTET